MGIRNDAVPTEDSSAGRSGGEVSGEKRSRDKETRHPKVEQVRCNVLDCVHSEKERCRIKPALKVWPPSYDLKRVMLDCMSYIRRKHEPKKTSS